jgi:type VI secretion system protein ImpG
MSSLLAYYQDDLSALREAGYLDAELSYLREAGREFVARNPGAAERLQWGADGRCDDPHVRRMIEAFALLSARVRAKLDDEFPELTHALLEALYPHFLRPIPSLSVVQFLPRRDTSVRSTVPRGSEVVLDVANADTRCRFRTMYPVEVWPVQVVLSELQTGRLADRCGPGVKSVLSVRLQCAPGTTLSDLGPKSLRFYLESVGTTAPALYEALLCNATHVEMRGLPGAASTEPVVLSPDAWKPVGFETDEGLLPYSNQSFPGYRLLQEYFAFPEKFLFVDLTGLSALEGRGLGQEAELRVFFGRVPCRSAGAAVNLRLGCTPAVNLFAVEAQPIALDQTRCEYRVVPDPTRPLASEVYSVDEVSGSRGFLGESTRYEPFLAPRARRRGASPVLWTAVRRPSTRPNDLGTEVSLAFHTPDLHAAPPADEVVRVRTTCSNRYVPFEARTEGRLRRPSLEGKADVGQVELVAGPTRPVHPPHGRGVYWSLITHLALNHGSLVDPKTGLETLRSLLEVYDFASGDTSHAAAERLFAVSSERCTVRTGPPGLRSLRSGTRFTVEFDETGDEDADTYLLACVLERFLGLSAPINTFTEFRARTRRGGDTREAREWTRWPVRSGERATL